MYQRDVPKIMQYVSEGGPDALLDVATFVLCTIRSPLSRVAEQVADVKQHGIGSPYLWGSKQKGYQYVSDNRDSLYRSLGPSGLVLSEALLETLRTPGLGLPKASFLLQCLGYDVGCLDSHNLARMGYSINVTKGRTPNKLEVYLSITRKHSSEWWWDSWCEYVAGGRHNKRLDTADKVSAEHVTAITGV